jgi:peptide methionine sulfoxide reductase MsrA
MPRQTRNMTSWATSSASLRLPQQPQYRSAVFVHSADRQVLATASRDAEQQSLIRPIVTQITPASAFYRAEE